MFIKLHFTNDGRMYSLGEVNFIQGMFDFGNPKNSVGLKPIAVWLSKPAEILVPTQSVGTSGFA